MASSLTMLLLEAAPSFLAIYFVRVFLPLFSRHIVLVAELAFIAAVFFARVGRNIGLPRLFWHEHPAKQRLAGFALTLLVFKVLFVGYLLDSADLERVAWGMARNTPPIVRLNAYLAGGAASFGFSALVLGAAFPWLLARIAGGRRSAAGREHPHHAVGHAAIALGVARSPMVAGGALALLAMAALALIVEQLFPWVSGLRITAWLGGFPRGGNTPAFHVFAAFFSLLLGLEFALGAIDRRGRWSTPATALCTMLGLVAAVWGFIVYRVPNPLIAFVLPIGMLLIGGIPEYKLRFKSLRHAYARRSVLSAQVEPVPAAPELIATEDIVWTRNGARRPLIVVCVSGGGIRSAVWTSALLTEIEKRIPDFPYHVRVIAGASGGMLGAAYYAATLRDPLDVPPGAWAHEANADLLVTNVAKESLSNAFKRLVYWDIPHAFLPIVNRHDRGEVIEQTWCENTGGALRATFADLRPGERDGWRPSLVFSPVLVEDGRRMFISNLDMDFVALNCGAAINPSDGISGERFYSRSAYELARLFPREWNQFPLCTAIRMSAAFPIVTPAAVLPTLPRRRVVDAGYYDNYGVNIVGGWLDDVLYVDSKRRWLEQNVSAIAVIQIRDGVCDLTAQRPREAATSPAGRGMEGIVGPIEALFAARESVPVFRNDEQIEGLSKLFRREFGDEFFTTVVFEFTGRASLNWYLTQQECATIRLMSTDAAIVSKIDALALWMASARAAELRASSAAPASASATGVEQPFGAPQSPVGPA